MKKSVSSKNVRYRSGYTYQTVGEHWFDLAHYQIGTLSGEEVGAYLSINSKCQLRIREGYAWDGPSGPAWDTKTAMRASLAHDALYQLIRLGVLPPSAREPADRVYRDLCREDGMWEFRYRAHLWFLRRFAGRAADPSNAKPILTAP